MSEQGGAAAMVLRTALTERLGIAHPVLLAPMARVSGGALAAAVSRAGGLGLIGAGYGEREWLERELAAAGSTPIGVGFISWALARQPQLLELALAQRPRAILLSFGELEPFAARIRAAGCALLVQVQRVDEARRAAALGADVLIAQGCEAGGHAGARAALPLVPAVVDAVPDRPVLAAGGIGDARGLAAALVLGAAGALCGTAFYAAREALAHPAAQRALCAASGDAAQRSGVFDAVRGLDWPGPWQLRALENEFSRRWAPDPAGLRGALEAERRRYDQAAATGDFSVAAVIAGECADLVHAVEPAAAILERMVSGAAALLRSVPARVLAD